ncbi:MAG TPA: VCBS repeat-containing protein [Kofleriaceae bacterium]
MGSNVFGGWGAWNFATASQAANVQAVTGDFNHDGFTDIALVGGPWSTIKLASSYGNGNFSVLDESAPSFASWASTPNVKVLTGDFNGDGYTDLALTGVAGWLSIPVALSAGFGNFTVINSVVGQFGSWASTPGVRAIAGDFNGDGRTDIAITGGANWASIPVAFSVGGGIFSVTNKVTNRFPAWSAVPTATVVAGRFD